MQDLRLAIRSLRATPMVTAVAVLSLGLGIGANTAMFSFANSLLLRTLPVEDPHRLVTVSSDFALSHGYKNGIGWSYAMWDRLRQRTAAFDGAYAWTWASFNLAPNGERDTVKGMIASGDFFTTLHVPALLGRTFTSADDQRGGGPDGPVAVISYNLWQRRFGGDAAIIGTRLSLDRLPYTIVGVTPPEFFGIEVGEIFDVIVPLGTGPSALLDRSNILMLAVMLRLKPDQSIPAATAALRAMQPEILDISRSNAPAFTKEPYVLVPAATGSTDKTLLRQQYEEPLLAIAVVVALLLLIACANIANLLLARATARRHELSVRLALGAPRWRLARQLLVESLVLAAAGAALGLLVAIWGSRLIVAQLSTSGAPVVLDLSLDWRVMSFTAAVAVATAMLFGAAPAFRVSRLAPIDAMKEQGRNASASRSGAVSSSLVVVQIALSLILVVAAGLFLGTFEGLRRAPLGFEGDRVVVATVDMSRARLEPDQNAFIDRLIASAAAAPGVASAAASLSTPGTGGGAQLMIDARGKAVSDTKRVVMNAVTPGWFSTYGIALRAGRDVGVADTATAPPVVLVNETYAREFFPGQSGIGLAFGTVARKTIVGVVADVAYGSLRNAVPPMAYVPLTQSSGLGLPDRTTIQISARATSRLSTSFSRDFGAALMSVDQNLAFSLRDVAAALRASLDRERLIAMLSGFFGVLAVLLAGLGLYGVTSYAVNRRRLEIGVRMALGAGPRSIVQLVLLRVAVLVTVGVVLGGAVSAWLAKFVASLLYGLEPDDPLTFTWAAVVLAAVGATAGWIPARRASKIDPAEILRSN
jgi:predicted permease